MPELAIDADAPERVPELVEHLFRREHARLVAGLVRVLGPERLELAEDVVQDALHRALRTWSVAGIPDDPTAWLLTVARNRALDVARRERVARERAERLARWSAEPAARAEQDLDALHLVAACCHPALPIEARVALTLKTASGFGVAEIARALCTSEDAVAQRILRAKQRLAGLDHAAFDPEAPLEPARRAAVLEVLYLLFNEGHSATTGDAQVRGELVHEALRLGRLFARRPADATAELEALLALQLFLAARLPARVDAEGDVVTLARQDRARWDRALLAEAWTRFERACAGDELTSAHVEAAIAAAHAAAPSYAATDWRAILEQYDLLARLAPSPVVALNRAVALAKAHGIAAGLAELDRIAADELLELLFTYHATRGLFLWHAGRRGDALDACRRALAADGNAPERALVARRIESIERGDEPEPF
ncbi:MAG: sigma-70 family RNA polymerase sigma factor [Planctomycetes bacterium]|nr:sigma-70 family RNA polymerase sigma factor [Planctomycetota bacterium]